MSASQLSDVVVRKILQDLKKRYATSPELFEDKIREITNKNQDGIISSSSLEILKAQFSRAASTEGMFKGTIKKFIKQEVNKYKFYPAVYNYLLAQSDTEAALRNLVNKVIDMLDTANLFNDFFTWYTKTYPGTIKTQQLDNTGQTTGFIASGLDHGEFNKRFKQFLLGKGFDNIVVEFFDANTDAGHFIGVFNLKLAKLFDIKIENINNFSDFTVKFKGLAPYVMSADKDVQDAIKLEKTFEEIFKLLAEADAISGNLLPDMQLLIETSKEVYGSVNSTQPKASVSIELSYLNTRSGRKINGIGRRIQNLAKLAQNASVSNLQIGDKNIQVEKTADFKKELGQLFKSTSSLGKYIEELGKFYDDRLNLDDAQKKIIQDIRKRSEILVNNLVEASGSDSIIESIGKTMVNTLTGKKIPATQKTNVKNKDKLSTTIKPSNKNFALPKVKPATTTKSSTSSSGTAKKINLNLKGKLGVKQAVAPNLLSLHNLLNLKLQQVVRENMGTGNRRDVLNYRSGRFAQSVEVVNVSEARTGAVTAFYTYMKNPYATFSQGGKQQYPRSRDPKTLISKSIRQVAQELAVNRLRTVLV